MFRHCAKVCYEFRNALCQIHSATVPRLSGVVNNFLKLLEFRIDIRFNQKSCCALNLLQRCIGRDSGVQVYVKKHVKQYLDASDLAAAWNFLLPIGTGSRYINEFHGTPAESELFPVGPHIRKVVNCFKEATPKETDDDYSYLSEFCHPNMMTFSQHYLWTTPRTIEIVDQVEIGAFGTIAASTTQGLIAIHELLGISNEGQTSGAILRLLKAIVGPTL